MRLNIGVLADVPPIGRICHRPACAPMPESPCLPDNARRQAGSRVHKHCLGRTPAVCARPARSCFPMSTVFRPSVVWSCFNSSDGERPTGGAQIGSLAPAASSLRQTAAAATASTASTPPYNLCTPDNLCSLSTRVARRLGVFGRFPCRRHRRSPG
jgi:hypothetical protein